MAGKKVQVPVLGGLRKVVIVQNPAEQAANPGTTIAEFANQTVTLAQLKTALGITTQKSNAGGGGSAASLVLGPGLTGGGPLVGAVHVNLGSPTIIYDDQLFPDESVTPAGSGTGISTLAGLNDVHIVTPIAGQVLGYNGTKWANANLAGIAGGPLLVQSNFLRWDGSGSSTPITNTISLSATPTVGNVLVVVSTGYDTTSNNFLTLPTGFSRIAYFNVNNSEGVVVGVRVVQTGDGTTYTVGGGNGGDTSGIWEFSGVLNVVATQVNASGSSTTLTVADVPALQNSYNIGVAQTDSINHYSSITNANLLFDGTSSLTGTANHPGVMFEPFAMTNVLISYTGTTFTFPIGALVSVQGPPGNAGTPPTPPSPVIIDDQLFADDATIPAVQPVAIPSFKTPAVLLDDQLFADDVAVPSSVSVVNVQPTQTAVMLDDQLFSDDVAVPAPQSVAPAAFKTPAILLDDQLFSDDIAVASPAFAQAVQAVLSSPVVMDDQIFADDSVLPASTSPQAAGADTQVQFNQQGFLSASSKFAWSYSGNMLFLSQNASAVTSASGSPNLVLAGVDGGSAIIQLQTYTNGTASQSAYRGITARGTAASPAALQLSDNMLRLLGIGHNGSAYSGGVCSMNFQCAENWTTTANGTRVIFSVTKNTTTSPFVAFTIENDGGIFATNATGASQGSGTVNATGLYGSALTVSQGTVVQTSSVSTPGILLSGADGASAAFHLQTYSNGTSSQSTFRGITARGTYASPAALQANDFIFRFASVGYDGTAYSSGTSLTNMQASENWSSSAHGTRASWGVTKNGTTSTVVGMTLENDGGLWMAGTTSQGIGTINATGLYINSIAVAPNPLAFASVTIPAGNTVANTTSATAFTSSYTIAASTLVVGSVIRVKLRGVFSTALAAPSLTVALKLGSTTVLTTGAITTVGSLTNVGWSLEALLIVQTSGSSGTLDAQGTFILQTATTSGSVLPLENSSTFTVNTTTSQAITAVVTWGTASASDTITLRQMAVWVETAASTA